MAEREIREWIERLEGGKYPQGTLALHVTREDGRDYWDALGVLCDAAVGAGVIPPPDYAGGGVHVYGGYWTVLPGVVRAWAGVSEGVERVVVGYNDSGKSFEDIAVYLRHFYGVEG